MLDPTENSFTSRHMLNDFNPFDDYQYMDRNMDVFTVKSFWLPSYVIFLPKC